MADIFVSYTSSDREWAFWIGQQLERISHTVHIHEWEISAGGDISAWMEQRHDEAEHILCVVSAAYLKAPYSGWERRAGEWASITERPNFVWPVFIENCKAPSLFAPFKRCDLHGLTEDEARTRLEAFIRPAAKPIGPVPFPGAKTLPAGVPPPSVPVTFPGRVAPGPGASKTLSNIPITVPQHFLGRDDDLAAIDAALKSNKGRVAITALHGLRGVGKTVLAAAYAERHRSDYRATWWIRAETESTMRADLVGLGVQLGWVASDEKEELALKAIMQLLRDDGQDLLLIYDNALNSDAIQPFVQQAGEARLIVTSNAPNWRGLAAPVEIEVWPRQIGADFLMARAGSSGEPNAALALSEALGGLPLAHEQAGAYCERIGVSFAEYLKRYKEAPVKLLDTERDAPRDYHDRTTVAKTFALAIHEAAKLHPAAELLIKYAALLAAEPIPLFFFSEAREKFDPAFASLVAGDGLDESVAALRAFALVDRERVQDERNALLFTDCIRLHRLVRDVAAGQCKGESLENARRELIEALSLFYPDSIFEDPGAWPRARRLDSLAMPLVVAQDQFIRGSEAGIASVLNGLACFRVGALAAHGEARSLLERALKLNESGVGVDHPDTARSLNNLGYLLGEQGDPGGSKAYYERALAIRESALGPDHLDTATTLNNLGGVLNSQGEFAAAKPYYKRALGIREKVLGSDHPATASVLSNLRHLLQDQCDLAAAKPYIERALAIREKALITQTLR